MAAVYCENIRVFQESLKKENELFNHRSFCLPTVTINLRKILCGDR